MRSGTGPMIAFRHRATNLALLALLLGGGTSVAAADWQPISPGEADWVVEIAEVCPTFSWVAPRSSSQVRIVVVDISNGDWRSAGVGHDAIVLEARLPGGARSWTPSAGQCLHQGRTYRWFVVDGEGEIANASGYTFEISRLPSEMAIDWARDVLRRHLGDPAPTPDAQATQERRPPADVMPKVASSGSRSSSKGPTGEAVASPFSADATVGVLGGARVTGLRAVASPSSSGDILAEGSIVSLAAPLLGSELVFTDDFGADQITVSPPDSSFDLAIGGGVLAGALEAATVVRATSVQVPSGIWTGDDGGIGVEYVDQKSCGFLGLDRCIRVDENETFCTGGSFVVAARLWQTDNDQVGVQVKCTDPLPLSDP